jgi:Tol biopolymer transport system component/protocatechuate 3,4-dioxygenase beta subunit
MRRSYVLLYLIGMALLALAGCAASVDTARMVASRLAGVADPAATAPAPLSCIPTPPGPTTTSPIDEAPVRASVGSGQVLTGVVRESAGCSPIQGAKIIFWLANPQGVYDEAHRATVFTDAQGRYRFESNVPGAYEQLPPHIHLFVSAEGYRSVEQEIRLRPEQTASTFDLILAPAAAAIATPTTCSPTLALPAGPNYVWQAPVRSSVGSGHVLAGVVRSSRDCAPLAGARLEFWLAGPDGQYGPDQRATIYADETGAFRFESNFPGSYPERPTPHIHLFVSAPGHRSLTTEYHPRRGQETGTLALVLALADTEALVSPADRPLASTAGRIAFHSLRDGQMEIYAMNADGSEPVRLTKQPAGGSYPVWSPSGAQIAFVSNQDRNPDIYLMARDGSAVTNLTGHPAEDLDHVWSPDGQQMAIASNRDGDWEIYRLDVASGEVTQLTHNRTDDDWSPAWSPDGRRIAFSSLADIWVMEADGSGLVRLTDQAAEDDMSAWSPDGTQLVFASTRHGNWEIYTMQADGSDTRRLTDLPAEDSFPTWSPDGTRIAFRSNRDGNYEIYVMNSDGSGVTRLTDHPAGDGFPSWQPAARVSCTPTPGHPIGGLIYDGAFPAQIVLPRAGEPGERLILTGAVYLDDCTPLTGAHIRVWQADANGDYTYLEGDLHTDEQGRYRIETIRPGFYGAPAHIHLRADHPRAWAIETEIFFAGDAYLTAQTPPAQIVSLTPAEDGEGPYLHGVFDIVVEARAPSPP